MCMFYRVTFACDCEVNVGRETCERYEAGYACLRKRYIDEGEVVGECCDCGPIKGKERAHTDEEGIVQAAAEEEREQRAKRDKAEREETERLEEEKRKKIGYELVDWYGVEEPGKARRARKCHYIEEFDGSIWMRRY